MAKINTSGTGTAGQQPTSRRCTKCGLEKPFSAFHKARLGRFGLTARCKGCETLSRLSRRPHGPYRVRPPVETAERWGLEAPPPIIETDTGPVIHVPLTRGAVAVIDAADWPFVQPYRWNLATVGYATANVVLADGRRTCVTMHRLLLGVAPRVRVDHRDGDKINNRRSNLRLATPSQNGANSPGRRTGVSGFRGVTPARMPGRWFAQITVNRKHLSLGVFDTPEEAARAYNAAALAAFGEFAVLNDID